MQTININTFFDRIANDPMRFWRSEQISQQIPFTCIKTTQSLASSPQRYPIHNTMPKSEPTKMRINKFLSSAGVCSRREADKLIEQKQVRINGKIAKLGDQISLKDKITVKRKPITTAPPKKIYIALHKPFGVITTTNPESKNNIMQYIDIKTRVYPIGRLDVESSGLILLTNDGDIVNKLLRSRHKVEKEYLLTTNKHFTEEAIKTFTKGVILNGRKTLPAKVKKITANKISITIVQGMNRQIRRMCEKIGFEVKVLKRIRFASIKLDDLPRGKWRFLTDEEIKSLTNN